MKITGQKDFDLSEKVIVENYQCLSQFYDFDWGGFSTKYINLVNTIFAERNIKNARILDLACGIGKLAIMLAESGHIVKGIDLSAEMIKIAKSKSKHLSNISFEVGDMVTYMAEDHYDLVICTFDSVNYLLELTDVKDMFANVAKELKKSGLFLFDFNTENQYLNNHHGSYQKEIDGNTFMQRAMYQVDKKLAITEFEFEDHEIEVHMQKPYSIIEIEEVLAEVDLKIRETFAGFDKRVCRPESERIFCIAELKY